MLDIATLTIVTVTFIIAGLVKGVIGMGLPTVSLAILTVALDLPSAMALLLAPSLTTNAWQAVRGGHLRQLCVQLWPFFLPALLTIWVGVRFGQSLDVHWLSTLLGVLLIGYAGYGLAGLMLAKRRTADGPRSLPEKADRYSSGSKTLAITTGSINGLLTGLTGSFVVPGVMYLQSRDLPRDRLIQAMGILFTLSTLGLGLALASEHRIPAQAAWLSVAAIAPAFAGMFLGQRLRQSLSEGRFRQVFFISLLIMGAYIIASSMSV